jgi:hypothetical protein
VLPNALFCCLLLMWWTKVQGHISGFLCGGWKEEILSIWFYYFGSQILDLANISENLLGVLSSVFVVFDGGGTWSCI